MSLAYSQTNKGVGQWWKAKFREEHNFKLIRISARNDCPSCGQNLAKTKVMISGKLCGSLPDKTEKGNMYEIKCNIKGNEIKLVTVQNTHLSIKNFEAFE